MQKIRSVGVTVYGWLLFLLSVWSFLFGIGVTNISEILNPAIIRGESTKTAYERWGAYVDLFWIVIGLIGLILGLGLLKLKEWARRLTIIVSILWLVYFSWYSIKFFLIEGGVISDTSIWGLDTLGCVLSIMVLFYTALPILFLVYFLTRPKVKEQFR